MNEQEIETGEQGLSEFHQDYIRRWMEHELRMQEVSSDRFLRERSRQRGALDPQLGKMARSES